MVCTTLLIVGVPRMTRILAENPLGSSKMKTTCCSSDKCFCGVVVVERIYANVSYCSFVAPGDNSLEVYERVK